MEPDDANFFNVVFRGSHSNRLSATIQVRDEEARKFIDTYREECGYSGIRKAKSVEMFPYAFTIRSLFKTYRQTCVNNGLSPLGEFR